MSNNQTANVALPEIGTKWSLPHLDIGSYEDVPEAWEVLGWHLSKRGYQAVCKAHPFDTEKLYSFAMLPVELFTFPFNTDPSLDIDYEDVMDQFRETYPQYDALAYDGATQHAWGAVVVDERRVIMGCTADNSDAETLSAAFSEAMDDALEHANEENPPPSWRTIRASLQLIADVFRKGGADVDWVEIAGVAWLIEPVESITQNHMKAITHG